MLIRNAEIWHHGVADLRVEGYVIAAIGELAASPNEKVVDADGGALLPGLHDHHVHLAATAMARLSVPCGPPDVRDEAGLAVALAQPGIGWLRGIGYHESVAGMLERQQLDRLAPDRPVRIQHRSGRMWFLNSAALDILLGLAAPSPGLDIKTGQLFDDDAWIRNTLPQVPPSFADISAELAACGVTGITDMSVSNQPVSAAHFASEQARGTLPQYAIMAGRLDLGEASFDARLRLGPAKLHLHEWALPDTEEASTFIRGAHARGRAVAVHCTTEVELVYALSVLGDAGVLAGDRIEHAGIAPDHLIAEIAALRLAVCSQPHFLSERGAQYLADVPEGDHPHLYRLAAFERAGAVLAGGSDAPYGSIDPWTAMRAAVWRPEGFGVDEALSPEAALSLYLADPLDLARHREIKIGGAADLCLLDRPWREARERLLAADVGMTIANGSIIYNRINQPPT